MVWEGSLHVTSRRLRHVTSRLSRHTRLRHVPSQSRHDVTRGFTSGSRSGAVAGNILIPDAGPLRSYQARHIDRAMSSMLTMLPRKPLGTMQCVVLDM
jgi:hypothetical protein